RIDVDSQGVTYIALTPPRRTQSFRWQDLGNFSVTTKTRLMPTRGRGQYTVLEAPILAGPSFRRFGVFPSSKLTVHGIYGTARLTLPVSDDELCDVVESHRPRPNPRA